MRPQKSILFLKIAIYLTRILINSNFFILRYWPSITSLEKLQPYYTKYLFQTRILGKIQVFFISDNVLISIYSITQLVHLKCYLVYYFLFFTVLSNRIHEKNVTFWYTYSMHRRLHSRKKVLWPVCQ